MNKKSLRFTGIAVAAATFVAGIATMSVAATQANGSYGALHIFDATPALIAPASSMTWDAELLASGSASDSADPIVCPVAATKFQTFISERTFEASKTNWSHSGTVSPFASGKNVVQELLTPANLNLLGNGTLNAELGGEWSLGIACMNASNEVVASYYRYITVTAAGGGRPKATFVAAATTDAATATPTPTATADATMTGSIALSATTMDAVNGTLSLSVPESAAATFGTPTLVNNKSTTTGALPFVTVSDGRVVTKQGWTLSADVADFTSGTAPSVVTIPKSALGIAPSISVGSTTAAGYFAGTATVAGNATYPFTFAHAAANNTVGNTVVGGALTFVAPQDKAAGTYTSTLTLTLASK